MVGYDDGSFGAADLVTPAAACTVILRHLGYPESSGWDYSTACDKLISLGLAPSELAEKSVVTRGDMAILLYRAMRSPEGGSIGVAMPPRGKQAKISRRTGQGVRLPAAKESLTIPMARSISHRMGPAMFHRLEM